MNKVFGKHSSRDCSQPFTSSRLQSKSVGATSQRICRQLLRSLPPPLIDDLAPPLATSSPYAVERYTSRDPMSPFMLFDMVASVQDMFILVLLFMLLDHASIQAMFNLVLKFVMIYIMVLI
jgi:hypothetical protein